MKHRSMVLLKSLTEQNGLQTGPFGSQLKAEEYTEDGVPVIMPYNIYGGKISVKKVALVSQEKATKLSKHRLLSKDILFPRRGDLGRIATVSEDNVGWLCGSGCLRARFKSNVNTEYIHQYLQLISVKRWLETNALGQTMLNLNTDIIGNLPIFIVPLQEQVAIAGLLSTWDQAIEKTERLIAAKETQFSWLGLILINEQSKKHGWYKLKLGDICEPVTRKNDIGETNTLTSSAKRGLISQLDYYSKSVSGTDLSRYCLLKKGEFAYNRSSANGYPYGAIKRLDYCDQGVFSTLYLCFKISDKGKIYSDFLCNYFEAGCMNRALMEICQAGARSHGLLNVTKGEFFNLKLFIPPIDQQKQIASILNTARQEIDLIKKQLEAYRKQKRGLMQKLLTGQWRVKINTDDD